MAESAIRLRPCRRARFSAEPGRVVVVRSSGPPLAFPVALAREWSRNLAELADEAERLAGEVGGDEPSVRRLRVAVPDKAGG